MKARPSPLKSTKHEASGTPSPKPTKEEGQHHHLPFTLTVSESSVSEDEDENDDVFADAMSQQQDKMMTTSSGEMAKLLDDRLKTIATKENFNQIMEKVDVNTEAIRDLRGNIDRNASEIEGIKLAITRIERESDRNEKRLEERLNILEPTAWTSFQKSRSSIHMWPIPGKNEADLIAEVKKFLTGALRQTVTEFEDFTITSTRRRRSAPATKVHSELLVTFSEPNQRDFVFSKGSNLSEYVRPGTSRL